MEFVLIFGLLYLLLFSIAFSEVDMAIVYYAHCSDVDIFLVIHEFLGSMLKYLIGLVEVIGPLICLISFSVCFELLTCFADYPVVYSFLFVKYIADLLMGFCKLSNVGCL